MFSLFRGVLGPAATQAIVISAKPQESLWPGTSVTPPLPLLLSPYPPKSLPKLSRLEDHSYAYGNPSKTELSPVVHSQC